MIAYGKEYVTLPERWAPLRYHPMQARLWRTAERDVKVCAGRGSGKTELARRKIVRSLRVKRPWRDPRYFYALPTYAQCRRVAREHILSLIPRGWLTKVPGDSAMEFKTVFGSWLFLVGMDQPSRVEGDQYDGGILDESSDQKKGVYGRTLRPALTHRKGFLWRIGVPKRFGPGATEFRLAFERGTLGVDSFTWPSWDILSPDEIAELQRELDDKDYNEQIGGNWESAGGKAYYQFSQENVDADLAYNPERIIHVGMDFNVDPMAWVLAHKSPEGLQVFDELWKRGTNTEDSLDALHSRYPHHKAGWVFIGDASSNQRRTSSTTTDRAILANDQRFNATMKFDDSNPAVKNRLASVNALLKNKLGERRLKIHPRCEHLINDLIGRALNEWGEPSPAVPGEAHDSGHATDALGYMVYKYYPIKMRVHGQKLVVIG